MNLLARHATDEPAPRVTEDDPVYLIYTSGTTGVPRGALYTHARAMHNIAARLAETPVEAGDKAVLTLQLFHVAGMPDPYWVELVDSLPKNASGKIDKLVLKRRFA